MKKWLKKMFGIHKHNYTIPTVIKGIRLMKCDYPGCSCYDDPDLEDMLLKDSERLDQLLRNYNNTNNKFKKLKDHYNNNE